MPLDPLDIRYFKTAVGNVHSETEVDIAARCPICGDSRHSNKARLHLYRKGNLTLVNCFNGGCPCTNITLYTFLRNFYPQLFHNYKQDKFRRTIRTGGLEDMVIDLGGQMLSNQDCASETKPAPKPEPPATSLRQFFGALSPKCKQYIEQRGITNYQPYVFTARSNAFLDGKRFPIDGFIIIPLIKGNEIYGFYTRCIETKRFYTYIKPSYAGYKAWNIFNVDAEQPVYAFEGIFDALAAMQAGVTNCIALMGAKASENILKMFPHLIFCLDNDRTGIINSLTYCKQHRVVVWPYDEFKDANEMLNAGIDLKDIITNNQLTGIRATIALKAKL